ncbi:GATA zinc finger domain-containing protein 10-like isoform X2 [Cucumis melo var. makuwa]|uniref:GATA zinc finger domain-containing protein 10-like isoform X2 n=1 Tax=Cucumis melo var. makuwa TaxID=1194695 RepID=A0A5D3E0G1_CUCMM|nr:GATA zinc finger domain-containing protein 10-like isoform X2 [Cucumis melo var. makuwa]
MSMTQAGPRYNNNDQYMENIHYIDDVPIVPIPVQRRHALVQELDELEEVPYVTQTQSETGYVSPMMMMPTFETRYYDLGVGQSSNFGIGYYNMECRQQYSSNQMTNNNKRIMRARATKGAESSTTTS